MILQYIGGPLDGSECEIERLGITVRVPFVLEEGDEFLVREVEYNVEPRGLVFVGYTGYSKVFRAK